mmetsp:Transcript_93900/g.223400  ORF Transcript_93900/g.223400 Transcript_93900/m.223400 type:complete len:254 (+) Transcript_93900:796-1557(+)
MAPVRQGFGVAAHGVADHLGHAEVVGLPVVLAQHLEVEWHIKLGLLRGAVVLHEVFQRCIDLPKDHALTVLVDRLPPALDDLMVLGVVLGVVVHHAVPDRLRLCTGGIEGLVAQLRVLQEEGHRVDAKASHAEIQPEAQHLLHCLDNLWVAVVEVRLELAEGVVVVLLCLLIPGPRGAQAAPKVGGPVVGGPPLPVHHHPWVPHVPIAFGACLRGSRLLKPLGRVGAVVGHKVHEELDAQFLGRGNKVLHILH